MNEKSIGANIIVRFITVKVLQRVLRKTVTRSVTFATIQTATLDISIDRGVVLLQNSAKVLKTIERLQSYSLLRNRKVLRNTLPREMLQSQNKYNAHVPCHHRNPTICCLFQLNKK